MAVDTRWKTKVRLEPQGARILVKPIEEDDVSDGGIVLPDSVREKPQRGVVAAVGPGDYAEGSQTRRRIPLKPDEVVLYAKYSGSEVKVNGEEMLILREEDVLAVERVEGAEDPGTRPYNTRFDEARQE